MPALFPLLPLAFSPFPRLRRPIELSRFRRNSIIGLDVPSCAATAPGRIAVVLVGLGIQPRRGEEIGQIGGGWGAGCGAAGAVLGAYEEEGDEEGGEEDGCEDDLCFLMSGLEAASPALWIDVPLSGVVLACLVRRRLHSAWETAGVLLRALRIRHCGVSCVYALQLAVMEVDWVAETAFGGARVR